MYFKKGQLIYHDSSIYNKWLIELSEDITEKHNFEPLKSSNCICIYTNTVYKINSSVNWGHLSFERTLRLANQEEIKLFQIYFPHFKSPNFNYEAY